MQRSGGRRDGCATFWRRARLRATHVRRLKFHEYDLSDNVALLVALRPLRCGGGDGDRSGDGDGGDGGGVLGEEGAAAEASAAAASGSELEEEERQRRRRQQAQQRRRWVEVDAAGAKIGSGGGDAGDAGDRSGSDGEGWSSGGEDGAEGADGDDDVGLLVANTHVRAPVFDCVRLALLAACSSPIAAATATAD